MTLSLSSKKIKKITTKKISNSTEFWVFFQTSISSERMLLSHFKLGERDAKNKGKVTKKMEWKSKRGKKINIKVWLWYQKGRDKTISNYMNELWFLSNQPQQGVVTYLLKPNTYEKNLNLILPDSSICSFSHFQRVKRTGENRGVRNVSQCSPLKVLVLAGTVRAS